MSKVISDVSNGSEMKGRGRCDREAHRGCWSDCDDKEGSLRRRPGIWDLERMAGADLEQGTPRATRGLMAWMGPGWGAAEGQGGGNTVGQKDRGHSEHRSPPDKECRVTSPLYLFPMALWRKKESRKEMRKRGRNKGKKGRQKEEEMVGRRKEGKKWNLLNKVPQIGVD